MPSTRNHNDHHDTHDSHSIGNESDIDMKKHLEYVQYRKNNKGGTIALFPSNNARRHVVNAVTGFKYDGVYAMSRDSRRFFRVVDATAPIQTRVDENGVRHSYNSRDSNTFYYDSPEEYVKFAKMRGIRPTISKNTMFAWHEKNRAMFGGDDFMFVGGDNVDEFGETTNTVIH